MRLEPNLPVILGLTFFSVLAIFTSCSSGEVKSLSEKEKAEYLQNGKEIVNAAFTVLSSRLKQAIQQGGPVHAIEYCRLEALPITDSISKAFNVRLKRTSTKLRNPANRPTPWELEVLHEYQQTMEKGEEPQAKVIEIDNEVVFTAPIRVLPQCLVCHGEPGQDITTETMETLARNYPRDEAKGYKPGELRGIWSVSFNQ